MSEFINNMMSVQSLLFYIFFYTSPAAAYKIYTVDDPAVCNQSLYLEQGENSAAILKLTSKPSYPTVPLFCTINFKVPIHHWSGLTGVLEQVDLRRYEDNGHHLGQPVCVDYITVKTEKQESVPNENQCGTWSIRPGQRLARLGYNKAIVGSCPHFDITGNKKCHATELQVIVSIGREKDFEFLWRNISWPPHKGFTFVVTAYSYPIKHGESECRDGLRSCGQADSLGARLGDHHCIHDSLWCDGHVNCGLRESMDEISCNVRDWDYFMTVVFGPWLGATIFLILMFCLILWYRSSKERVPLESQRSVNQEINSYAESYELSSNLSSAHHMAIQVRVVCNSNHPHHGSRNSTHQPWKNDLPPTYESLFPQGPPEPYSPIASITATVSQGSVPTVNAVGINVSSTMSLPSTVATTSGIRINDGTSAVDNSRAVTDITSIIDLNIRSNHLQTNHETESSEVNASSSNRDNIRTRSAISNIRSSTIDLNVGSDDIQHSFLKNDEPSTSSNTNQPVTPSAPQTNVTFITVTPNLSSSNEQCVSTQTDENSSKLDISLDSPTENNSSSSIGMTSEDDAQRNYLVYEVN